MSSVLIGVLMLGLLGQATSGAPDPKVQEAYNALIRQANLEKHPERHGQLAAWCRSKRWKSKAEYHDLSYRRYRFEKERSKLKDPPRARDLKRLLGTATRLKLEREEGEVRALWLEAEIKERRAKLKESDASGLKSLLDWAVKERAGSVAKPLALEVVGLDPQNEAANTLLGRVRDGESWVDPWDYFVGKGALKDVKARYRVHRQLETLRKEPKRLYPRNPLADCEKVVKSGWRPVWKDRIRGLGEGKGTQYIWAPGNYDPARPYPLVVALHGGGNGGQAIAEQQAFFMVCNYATRYSSAEAVVIAPWARNHVVNSWNIKENMLDVVDAVIDACARFNIDRTRIYCTGASMGGQGTQRLSWVVPELFAAFCPRAGAYHNGHSIPDLTGKPYLVIHGAKDAEFRNKSLEVFLKKIREANAKVEYVNLPSEGHILPHQKVYPRMLEFFKKHKINYKPDLRLVRRVVTETVTEKPRK